MRDDGGSTTETGTTGAVTGTDATPTESGSGSEETDAEETGSADSYSVTMSPMGEVTFDSVPQDVMVYSLLYADTTVAYGAGDTVNSLGFSANGGGSTLKAYYERLDSVSFDHEGLAQLNTGSGGGIQVEKELTYELDSDLHLVTSSPP